MFNDRTRSVTRAEMAKARSCRRLQERTEGGSPYPGLGPRRGSPPQLTEPNIREKVSEDTWTHAVIFSTINVSNKDIETLSGKPIIGSNSSEPKLNNYYSHKKMEQISNLDQDKVGNDNLSLYLCTLEIHKPCMTKFLSCLRRKTSPELNGGHPESARQRSSPTSEASTPPPTLTPHPPSPTPSLSPPLSSPSSGLTATPAATSPPTRPTTPTPNPQADGSCQD